MINCKSFFTCLLGLILTGCFVSVTNINTLPDLYVSASSPAFEKIVITKVTQKPFPADVALGHVISNNSQDMVITTWGDFLGRIGRGAEIGSLTIIQGGDKGDRLFAKQIELDAGHAAGSVAMADIDGDGKQDAVVAAMNTETRQPDGRTSLGQIQIFWGDGTSLNPGPKFPSPVANPRSIQIADIDGNDLPDVVIGTQSDTDKTIGLLRNLGNRKFELRKIGKLNGRGWPALVAKLTNSKYQDIVVIDSQYKTNKLWGLALLIGNNSGDFSQRYVPLNIGKPFSIAVGDLNSDGKPEIAVSTDSAILLLSVDEKGDFKQEREIDGTFAPGRLFISDLNKDGNQDIVVPTGLDELTILWGEKSGEFTGRTILSLKSSPIKSADQSQLSMFPNASYAIGDIDGDGWVDIVVPASSSAFATAYQDRAISLQDSEKDLNARGYLVIFRNRLSR